MPVAVEDIPVGPLPGFLASFASRGLESRACITGAKSLARLVTPGLLSESAIFVQGRDNSPARCSILQTCADVLRGHHMFQLSSRKVWLGNGSIRLVSGQVLLPGGNDALGTKMILLGWGNFWPGYKTLPLAGETFPLVNKMISLTCSRAALGNKNLPVIGGRLPPPRDAWKPPWT